MKKRRLRAADRIVSWNMQGGGSDATKSTRIERWIRDPRTYAVVLQECGRLFDWEEDHFPGWTIHRHAWTANNGATGAGNERCSMAIITRGTVLGRRLIQPMRNTRRPIIVTRTAQINIVNIHGPRNNPGFHQAALNRAFAEGGGRPTIAVGDNNLAPNQVIAPVGTQVVSGRGPTHVHGRNLDHATASLALNASVVEVGTVGASDHAPVVYDVEMP